MTRLGRRAFLAVVGLLASSRPAGTSARASAGAAAQPATVTLDEFLELSGRLTGRTSLDRAIGQTYLTAFLQDSATRPLLSLLVKRSPPTAELERLEREIIAAWYTGVYQTDGQPRLATHSGALMWDVVGRRAPGVCAGPPGSWSQPLRSTLR